MKSQLVRVVLPFLLAASVPPVAAGDGTAKTARLQVPLTVANRLATALTAEPVTSGVPFARGVLGDPGQVRLLRAGVEVPGQFLRTASWPDGSVRWLLVDFAADLSAGGSATYTLETGATPAAVSGVTVSESAESLVLATGAATYSFAKTSLEVAGSGFTTTAEGRSWRAVPDPATWAVEESGPMKVVVRVEGGWWDGATRLGGELIGFRCRLVFHRNRPEVRLHLTFRNTTSFGWEQGGPGVRVELSGLSLGSLAILPAGGSYVIGPGAEKTWQVVAGGGQDARLVDSRYDANGQVAAGYSAPPPLALAAPAYYAETGAWGRVVPPLAGFPAELQVDLDRFEKLQRAKVIPADVEDPPNLTGQTVWDALVVDLDSWNDYGDLRWAGNGCGDLSGNHYDWSYGMYLQLLRTGRLEFADAARLFASHEVDLDIYHTIADGEAFNRQKNWEERTSHDSPDNCFGGGRPTHTWVQGYALHWLLTGDPRGRDGFEELVDGIRRYVYESFNEHGYCSTSEIRLQGWLTDNLVALYRVDPGATLATSNDGVKTVPATIRDVLANVFDREAAAGGQGFVYPGDDTPSTSGREMLQLCYILEPLIKAQSEVFAETDPAYAQQLLGLIERMTRYVMSWTIGGDTSTTQCGDGLASCYRPLQIPFYVDVTAPEQSGGQIPYCLMAANAAGFCHLQTGEQSYRDYAVAAFSDFIRYYGVSGGDEYVDPSLRSPTAYNSNVYVDTTSKVHGWSNRFGQYLLADLATSAGGAPTAAFAFAPQRPAVGETVTFTDQSTGAPTSWAWSFGDGASSSQASPTHAYATAGSFTVSLTVANALGSSSATRSLEVAEAASTVPVLALPGVARSAGVGGAYFQTTLWAVNPGPAELDLRFAYFPAAGFDRGGAAESVERALPSGGGLTVEDVLTTLFGASSDTNGMIVVSVEEGGITPIVTARTYTSGGGAGTYGQFIRAVAIAPLGESAPTRVLTGLGDDAASRTNVGVVNLGASGLEALVVLRDAGGAAIGEPVAYTVPAGSLLQRRVAPAAGLADVWLFRADVTASGTWFAYASKLDNQTSDPVFIPDDLAAAGEQRLDGVAAAAGAGGAYFRSTLSLANLGPAQASVTVSYLPLGSAAPAATAELTLPAGSAWLAADALGELFSLEEGNGSLRLQGDPVVAWARTYNDTPTGTYGQFIPAFASSTLLSSGSLAYLPGLAQREDESAGGFRTNAGLVNLGGSAATLVLTARGETGESLGSANVIVAAGSTLRLNRVLRTLGLAGDVEGVTLVLEPDPGGAPTYGWASVVDNLTGDAIFVPQVVRAAVRAAAATAGPPLVYPD